MTGALKSARLSKGSQGHWLVRHTTDRFVFDGMSRLSIPSHLQPLHPHNQDNHAVPRKKFELTLKFRTRSEIPARDRQHQRDVGKYKTMKAF